MGFSKRRKDKLAKQPPYSEEVLQAMKLAPFMGISVSGKDENKSLALLSAIDKEHKKDAAGELERTNGKLGFPLKCCESLEVGSFVCNVMYLEREKCKEL
jgi:hypothetical protein